MRLAPIILFVYNRPQHVLRTIESLKANIYAKASDLFIFSDGPRNQADAHDIKEVRELIWCVNGFRSVTIHESVDNKGLAKSVIEGVTKVLTAYERVIVLEDDLVTSPRFLEYMNKALEYYKDCNYVGSITGSVVPISIPHDYPLSVYLSHRHNSWGWATYSHIWHKIDWDVSGYDEFVKDRNMKADFNIAGNDMAIMLDMQMKGEIDSWSIRFDYFCFRRNLYCIVSTNNYVYNIGFDGSGMHSGRTRKHLVELTEAPHELRFNRNLEFDQRIVSSVREFFSMSLGVRIAKRIKRSLYRVLRWW